ncbi:MAG: hypothetical protein ACSHWU_09015 [Marinicella sp.]
MNHKEHKSTRQYLSQYSHGVKPEKWHNDWQWEHILIIPVCGEAINFLDQVLQYQTNQSVLLVIIVNRPESHPKTQQWQAENNDLITALKQQSKSSQVYCNEHQLLFDIHGHDLLLLDYNSVPFDSNKGVGLARKIAADTALYLISKRYITVPWIYSTDADVILPPDYFSVTAGVSTHVVAISLAFNHFSEQKQLNDMQHHYDFKLRYYQKGIRYIGVAYDYIPLGSTLIVKAINYAKVRGFPSRSGGEDFYLLNKLCKVGQILQPTNPKVEIKIRRSLRVPFGTGPALIKIEEQLASGGEIKFYHPEVFHVLKNWRIDLINYRQNKELPDDEYSLNQFWKIADVLTKADKQIRSQERWIQFIHEWFDAFKILKSVHHLNNKFNLLGHDEIQKSSRFRTINTL